MYIIRLICFYFQAVIAAAMTTKSPFVAPLDKLDLANLAKKSMSCSCSDHLTLYRAYTGYHYLFKLIYKTHTQLLEQLISCSSSDYLTLCKSFYKVSFLFVQVKTILKRKLI